MTEKALKPIKPFSNYEEQIMDTYWAEQHWCLYLGGAEVISTFISGRVGGYTGERLFKNWNANQILARIWVTD